MIYQNKSYFFLLYPKKKKPTTIYYFPYKNISIDLSAMTDDQHINFSCISISICNLVFNSNMIR